MSTDETRDRAPTRREYLTYGGALVGAGQLAGCTGGDADATPAGDGNGSSAAGADDSATGDGGGKTHTTTLSPAGEVTFEGVPERDGHVDAVNAVYVPEMSGTTMNHYYHHLEGVSVEWDDLHDPLSDGLSKEQLYELDSDVHLVDPAWASAQDGWSRADVEAVGETLAPWFGNFYSGTRDPAPDGFDDYEYYTLWELFEAVSAVFDERARYEALAEVHGDLVDRIDRGLPPKAERPTAVRATLSADGSKFWTYHLNEPGYWLADTRPLGANDAFADEDWGGLFGTVDYEVMLEADPDVILHLWGVTPNYRMAETLRKLNDHAAGKQLQAVQNDRVYPAGMRYQGPVMNLFQLEMGAKQLYPEQFGAWPDYEDGEHYPEISEEEQLFDRQRVADVVNGNLEGSRS